MQRLLAAAQRAKHTLTAAEETRVELENLHDGADFFATVTRSGLEALIRDLLDEFASMVQSMWASAVRIAGGTKAALPRLLLSGGCCRVPKLREMMQEIIGEEQVIQPAGEGGGCTLGTSAPGELGQASPGLT